MRDVPLVIGFLYTDHCNASCSHCSTDCGPKSRTYLDENAIYRVIDEALELEPDRPLQVCFSGGEPFLDTTLLHRLVSYAGQRARDVSCVTNGFWATTEAVAEAQLRALANAGLTGIALSASEFHAAYVSPARVRNALSAAGRLGLGRVLKFPSVVGGEDAIAWAKREGCDLDGVTVEQFAIMPTLRTGFQLAPEKYPRIKGIPKGACPGATMTYRETGEAFTCCTPGGFVEPLRIGHIEEQSFAAVLDRFVNGGVQQVLRSDGPSGFVETIRASGLGDRLRDEYDGICDLCTHLMGDPVLATACRAAGAAREVETLAEWFGVRPPSTRTVRHPDQQADL